MGSPCLVCPCPPPLYSCGAVYRLQWLWQRQWREQWLRPGRRQWLLLWQRSRPWSWLQFWQWQRPRGWSQLCWGQQFHHQIHHHHLLQREDLQALKSSSRLLVPRCVRAPIQLHGPVFKSLLFSCFHLLLVLELELELPRALLSPLCLYLLHLSFHHSPPHGLCLRPTPAKGSFPWLSPGPGIPCLPVWAPPYAVVMKAQAPGSMMYRACIPTVCALFPVHY